MTDFDLYATLACLAALVVAVAIAGHLELREEQEDDPQRPRNPASDWKFPPTEGM